MKRFRNSKCSIIIAFLVLFSSCNQYDNSNESIFDPQLNNNYFSSNKYERVLTDTTILEIGKNHNLELNRLFEKNPNNIDDVFERSIELFSGKGLSEKLLKNYFQKVDSLDTFYLVSLIEKNKSKFVKSNLLIEKILEIDNINDVMNLKSHENESRKVLEGIDLDIYLVLTTVYQYSLNFWEDFVSEKNSGSLKTNTYLLKLAHEGEPGNWKRADGISAAIGFVTLALAFAVISGITITTGGTGTIPTITIVASLLRISTASALASIYAFFNI